MERPQRVELIRKIEQLLGLRIICYITGDRENVNTRVAPDITRVFYEHLEKMGRQPRLDLFLYTRGGDVLTPWRLVNLIREYAPRFRVLVPFRAYSAGTMICLGADAILMNKMGELGPIDPSVANAFNPQDPNNPVARIPVSVEDVFSYLALAREKAGLEAGTEMVEVFRLLTEKVHPLALGNVHRNYALIRTMARKLLLLRQEPQPEAVVQEIIDNLTEKLYAHNHMISRREALEDVRLPVIYPPPELEQVMWELYEGYEVYLKLGESFNPVTTLQDQEQQVHFDVIGGVIESVELAHGFVFSGTVTRAGFEHDGTPKVAVNMLQQTWRQMD